MFFSINSQYSKLCFKGFHGGIMIFPLDLNFFITKIEITRKNHKSLRGGLLFQMGPLEQRPTVWFLIGFRIRFKNSIRIGITIIFRTIFRDYIKRRGDTKLFIFISYFCHENNTGVSTSSSGCFSPKILWNDLCCERQSSPIRTKFW